MAYARESNQRADGGGFDAFTGLLGSGGWIASGKSVTPDAISELYAGPSAIDRASGTSIGTTYSQPYKRIDGFDLGSIDLVTDKFSFANLGFSYSRFEIGGFREATSAGALTGRSFDASYDAARLSAAKSYGRFGVGASANYYGISIQNRSKSAFGLDLGAGYSIDSARVLLNLRNLSGDRNDPDRLPIVGEIRGEWSPYRQMHLGVGGTFREDATGEYNVGIQYDIFKMISLLAGYQSGPKEWSAGAIARYQKINLQYGITAHRELDFSHTLSLGVSF
ncbi:MAG: hypothetical protein AAB229_08205 [Candidatus Hydrogenedentota bacterium]